jgi:hypothetical protein
MKKEMKLINDYQLYKIINNATYKNEQGESETNVAKSILKQMELMNMQININDRLDLVKEILGETSNYNTTTNKVANVITYFKERGWSYTIESLLNTLKTKYNIEVDLEKLSTFNDCLEEDVNSMVEYFGTHPNLRDKLYIND